MNAMEIMMKSVFKSLNLDADQITAQIAGIGQTIIAFKQQMDRIEENQNAIMKHMGIVPSCDIFPPEKELKNG